MLVLLGLCRLRVSHHLPPLYLSNCHTHPPYQVHVPPLCLCPAPQVQVWNYIEANFVLASIWNRSKMSIINWLVPTIDQPPVDYIRCVCARGCVRFFVAEFGTACWRALTINAGVVKAGEEGADVVACLARLDPCCR